MKLLSDDELLRLLNTMNPSFKLVPEQEHVGTLSFDVGDFKETGRYHLFFDFDAPPSFTEIGDKDGAITQSWELLEEIKFDGDFYLVFEFYPDVPSAMNGFRNTIKYKGKRLGVMTGQMGQVLRNMVTHHENVRKVSKAIGLSRISELF